MQMPQTAAERAAYMNSCAWMWDGPAELSRWNNIWRSSGDPETKVLAESHFWRVLQDHRNKRIALYETATGCCGAQIYFQEPLEGWALVLCPRCSHFVEVR